MTTSLRFDFSHFDVGMHALLARVRGATHAEGPRLEEVIKRHAVMPADGKAHPIERSGTLLGSIGHELQGDNQGARFGMAVGPTADYTRQIESKYPWFIPGARKAIPDVGAFWREVWGRALR